MKRRDPFSPYERSFQVSSSDVVVSFSVIYFRYYVECCIAQNGADIKVIGRICDTISIGIPAPYLNS